MIAQKWRNWKELLKSFKTPLTNLASVSQNVLVFPLCLHILAISFFEWFEKISLEVVALAVLKMSDL